MRLFRLVERGPIRFPSNPLFLRKLLFDADRAVRVAVNLEARREDHDRRVGKRVQEGAVLGSEDEHEHDQRRLELLHRAPQVVLGAKTYCHEAVEHATDEILVRVAPLRARVEALQQGNEHDDRDGGRRRDGGDKVAVPGVSVALDVVVVEHESTVAHPAARHEAKHLLAYRRVQGLDRGKDRRHCVDAAPFFRTREEE